MSARLQYAEHDRLELPYSHCVSTARSKDALALSGSSLNEAAFTCSIMPRRYSSFSGRYCRAFSA